MAERFKAPVLKTGDGQPSVSSNLTASATRIHPQSSGVISPALPTRLLAALACAIAPAIAFAAIEVDALWDFSRPEVSEQRFRAALTGAQGDDRLILQTQIARTFGLRRDFAQAKAVLRELTPALAAAGAEARARHALEWGRAHCSAAHRIETVSVADRDEARRAFTAAHELARQAGRDALAVDALHMMVFVDTEPAQQVRWNLQALDAALASTQPAARAWEGSLRNNLGLAFHAQHRYDEALAQFRRLRELRAEAGRVGGERIARWLMAWTLRAMGERRADEALAMQLALEQELEAAGQPDRYVFDELQTLYRARGDSARADHYAARAAALAKP